jgi:hypothetical protein
MRLISSSDNPVELLIVIFCSLPVPISLADTLTIPSYQTQNTQGQSGTKENGNGNDKGTDGNGNSTVDGDFHKVDPDK